MGREWFSRALQAIAITVTLAAVLQQMEKPEEERTWHGKVGFIPYNFRLPTLERLKDTCWNPHNHRIFTDRVFGIGWAINLHALLESMRIMSQSEYSEEDFLMPTESIKEILGNSPTLIEM